MDTEIQVFTSENIVITLTTGIAVTFILLISINRKLRMFFVVDRRSEVRPESELIRMENIRDDELYENRNNTDYEYNDNEDLYSDSDSYEEELTEHELDDEDNDRQRIILDSLFNQMPNLWLKPELMSMDYVYSLPTWKCPISYIPVGNGSSIESSDYTTCSSDEHSNGDDGELVTNIQSYSAVNNLVNGDELSITQEQQKCCKTLKLYSASGSEQNGSTSPAIETVISTSIPLPTKRKSVHRKKKRRNMSRKPLRESTSGRLMNDCEANIGEKNDEENDLSGKPEDSTGPPSWMIEMHNCAFCLEDYCCGDELCGLPCAHNFHLNCLAEWFRRDQRCPICRWPSYKFNHFRRLLSK